MKAMRPKRRSSPRARLWEVEVLEGRELMAGFTPASFNPWLPAPVVQRPALTVWSVADWDVGTPAVRTSTSRGVVVPSNPLTTAYYNASLVGVQPVSGWQGIRNGDSVGQYLITGTSNANGLLYEGPISGAGGTSYAVNYPNASSTSVYGPDNLGGGLLRLVGSYKNGDGTVHGFLFQGLTANLSDAANYRTIDYPGATYNYVHSTMGGFAVGNADGPEGNAPIGTGHAYLYNVTTGAFQNIVYPGSTSTTAYGIWYNGGTSYTVAGGYSNLLNPSHPVGNAYLVDYNSATGRFSNWTSFAYPTGWGGQNLITHFEGISSIGNGVYTLAADSVQTGSSHLTQGSTVTVRRNPNGTFGPSTWVNLNFPGVLGWTSNDSVAGYQAVGIVISNAGEFSYQATVNPWG